LSTVVVGELDETSFTIPATAPAATS